MILKQNLQTYPDLQRKYYISKSRKSSYHPHPPTIKLNLSFLFHQKVGTNPKKRRTHSPFVHSFLPLPKPAPLTLWVRVRKLDTSSASEISTRIKLPNHILPVITRDVLSVRRSTWLNHDDGPLWPTTGSPVFLCLGMWPNVIHALTKVTSSLGEIGEFFLPFVPDYLRKFWRVIVRI